jgi:hypothetical protein
VSNYSKRAWLVALFVLVLVTSGLQGCASLGAGLVTPNPKPTPHPNPTGSIAVTVMPSNATLILGNAQTFTATVANASDATVVWSVNGVAGGNSVIGTISVDGVYNAPADLPAAPAVQISATSVADTTKSGKSQVTIMSDLEITLSNAAAGVELGATQSFRALITSNGHPDGAVRWALSGTACSSGCGAVDANGNFSAPQILPSPANATLTAQSIADPSKRASATLTITSNFTLQLSAPASVPVGPSAGIVATLTPVPGSSPSEVLAWSLSGVGCSGASCGSLNVVTVQSSEGGVGAVANSATYVAPSSAPTPNTVTITTTPQADPSKRAHVTLAVLQGGGVILSPTTATLAGNHRVTLTALVVGVASANVAWSVNGIAGG